MFSLVALSLTLFALPSNLESQTVHYFQQWTANRKLHLVSGGFKLVDFNSGAVWWRQKAMMGRKWEHSTYKSAL